MNAQETFNSTIQNMFSNSKYENDYLFYACLVSQCTVIFDTTMSAPAGVSYNSLSYKLYINPDKFCVYSLEERLAILKHEMLHIINGHLSYRKEDREHENFNIATDCAINQLIDQNHLPKNCITPEYLETKLKSKIKRLEPAEYYYNLLNSKQIINDNSNISETDDSDNTDNIDAHETWIYTEDESDTQKIVTSSMLEEAKETTLRVTGDIPAMYSKWLLIHKTQAKVNWKKYLKSFVKNNLFRRSIFKPNRRYPERMDLKGKVRGKTSKILYIIDSSGSVKNSEFKKLNSEIISLCSEYNIEVISIQVDYEASEPEILTKRTTLIERKRNGGTLLYRGLEKAAECNIKYDTIIVSTDGYLSDLDVREFENTRKTVIFLICKNGSESVFKSRKKNVKYIKTD